MSNYPARRALTLMGLVLFVVQGVHAQQRSSEDVEPYKEWATVSLGSGTSYDLQASVTYNFGRSHFYQVSANHNANIFGSRHLSAVSASMGARAAAKYVVLAGFAGPSFVWGRQWRPEEAVHARYYTAGAALNGQLYLRPLVDVGTLAGIPFGGLGVGVDLHMNINPVETISGVGLGLYFGTVL